MDINNLNKIFANVPRSFHSDEGDSAEDKGWAYGVWYCGTQFKKSPLYGAYPGSFFRRAMALFPNANTILHAPSGSLRLEDDMIGRRHVTFDMHRDSARKPRVIGDCGALPFADQTFDLVLSDPPYSEEDSRLYGCEKFPEKEFMRESHRVLKSRGNLGFLAYHYPQYRREDWALCGLFAVVTGFKRRTRMFSVFERLP